LHDEVTDVHSEAARLYEQVKRENRLPPRQARAFLRWSSVNNKIKISKLDLEIEGFSVEVKNYGGSLHLDQERIWNADMRALVYDQAAINGDFRNAIIKLVTGEHPTLLAIIVPEMIGRKSRTDAQNAAKMPRTIRLDNDAMLMLVNELRRLLESHMPSSEKPDDQ
jgi:hypothetical protein